MKKAMSSIFLALTLVVGSAIAAPLQVTLNSDPTNPVSPKMGDHLVFRSTISNTGNESVNGVITWISLLRIDPGNEQPVDLEDWSAQKAITTKQLVAHGKVETEWPMRLINSGTYRVVISTATRDHKGVTTSPGAEFFVLPKPVVESRRVLPVALGIPILLGLVALIRRWRVRQSVKH